MQRGLQFEWEDELGTESHPQRHVALPYCPAQDNRRDSDGARVGPRHPPALLRRATASPRASEHELGCLEVEGLRENRQAATAESPHSPVVVHSALQYSVRYEDRSTRDGSAPYSPID